MALIYIYKYKYKYLYYYCSEINLSDKVVSFQLTEELVKSKLTQLKSIISSDSPGNLYLTID